MFFRKKMTLLLFLTLMTFLTGCATIPQKEVDQKVALQKAALEYWDLRMKDKYEDAYNMEYRQNLPPFNVYKNKAMMIKRMTVTSHSIKDVSIDGENAIVYVEFGFIMPPVSTTLKQVIHDKWLLKDGRWWHIME